MWSLTRGTPTLGLCPELRELVPAALQLRGILSKAKAFNGDRSENSFTPHEAEQGSRCNRPRKAFPVRSTSKVGRPGTQGKYMHGWGSEDRWAKRRSAEPSYGCGEPTEKWKWYRAGGEGCGAVCCLGVHRAHAHREQGSPSFLSQPPQKCSGTPFSESASPLLKISVGSQLPVPSNLASNSVFQVFLGPTLALIGFASTLSAFLSYSDPLSCSPMLSLSRPSFLPTPPPPLALTSDYSMFPGICFCLCFFLYLLPQLPSTTNSD